LAARDALAAKVFEQPDLVRFLSGHNDWVTHMASGGEGRVLVSVGRSGPALLWDVGSGRSMQALGEADSEIEAVALSRDGGSLALGDVNHRLTIWQLDRHTARAMLRHTLRVSVQSLAVSPDGKVLAGGDPSVGIRLWDTETSAQILVQPTEPLQVPRTMSFSHDGRLLASGDAKGRLVVWRREEDELRRVWEVVAGSKEVLRVVFSPTEGLLAWVHEGEDVIHYCRVDSQSGSALAACPSTLPASWPRLPGSRSTAQAEPDAEPYDGHTDSVVDLAFSPDGTRLASAGLDLSARVWEIPEGGPLEAGETLLHKLPVESVAFVEGGSRLATGVRGEEGTQNNRIRLWAVGVENGSLEAGPRMRGLGFDSKSGVLVAATSRKVTLWNTEGEELDWAPPPGRFTAMSVSGGWLVTGESLRRDPDGKAARITVWDLATRESMGELKLESEVSSLAADPARGLVAVGQRDGIVGLWRPGESDLAISTDVSGEVRTVSLAAEGNQLLAVSETGEMVSWDMKGSPVPARAHLSADVTSAGVSADGRFVALGTQSGEVLLWDNDSRQLVEMPGHRVHGEQDSVAAVAFSPDGRRLASASSFIHVWDLELERMQFSLPELDGEVSDLVFSSDGETLAFGYKSQVRLLPLGIERWVELACGRANRDLTPEEWRRYMIEGEPQSTCAAASVAVAGLVAAGDAGD